MEWYTVDFVSGKDVSQYLGIFHGLGIEESFPEALNNANQRMADDAQKYGADALLGVHYESFHAGKYFCVHASGTAVKW